MSELKAKRPALVEVKTLVEESYNLRDIDQAESEALKLETKVAQDEKRIQGFELAKQYSDVESQSNELTAKIKDLWHDNYLDRKKVDEYEKSITQEDKVSVTKIKNMYNELNKLLAENIKITLDEAMKFRKNLSKSRQDFLQTQIASIKEKITERDEEISELEKKRIALFNFLEAKEAIKDLSEAYLDLSRKRERLSELQGQLRTYHDLSREVSEREAASSSLFVKIETFCLEAKDELNKFRSVFHEVHDAIYEESKDRANFIFAANKKKGFKSKYRRKYPLKPLLWKK